MNISALGYGPDKLSIDLQFDATYLLPDVPTTALTREQISDAILHPVGSASLADLAAKANNVLIVVPDYTRIARCDLVLPPLLKTLHQKGIAEDKVTFIIAAGTHRSMSREEIACIVGLEAQNQYRILQHNSRDQDQLRHICTTARGTEAKINRILFEHDLVITIGAINAHYFAGFGGGRKMIFPGIAGREGIIFNHLLSIDFQLGRLADGVTPCRLQGNPVHEDMVEIVRHCPPHFTINTLLTEKNELAGLFCGDWQQAHQAAAGKFMEHHTVKLERKFDAVIASCGGYPKDTDLIQTHKSIFHASMALKPGGKLLMLAECRDGPGTKGFDENFPITDAVAFCQGLKDGKTKNGQTALSLHQKATEFEIMMMTGLPDKILEDIGIQPCKTIEDGLKWIGNPDTLAIMPKASITVPLYKSCDGL